MKTPTHCKNTCKNKEPVLTILGAEKILTESGSWSGFTSRMITVKFQREELKTKELLKTVSDLVFAYEALAKTAQAPSLLMETLSSINYAREALAKHTKQG